MAPAEKTPLAFVKSPVSGSPSRHGPVLDESADMATYDDTLFENPQFEHHEETSNIQLFFDLFFVANLTSFTNAHEINSLSKLSSYVGFFTVLWMTWVQVTLYDVRFATDSVLERIAHACHFGVMVGLAVIGPQFEPGAVPVPWSTLQELSLILMVSRAVLFCQYGSILYFVWRFRASRKPLIAIMATLMVAVILYLGISFAFYGQAAPNAYIAWYVIGVLEVFSNLMIAKWSDSISFKHTHLIERMTCLTLIILGEGIIGLTKTIAKIETLDFTFSTSAIGSIISGTLIIYFLYQLYFDNVRLEPFDSLRQVIWAGLHFPFHLALVLLMEGINQVFVWSHIVEEINTLINDIINIPTDATPEQSSMMVNDTINSIFDRFTSTETAYQAVQDALGTFSPSSNPTIQQLDNSTLTITTNIAQIIFQGFGWQLPETGSETLPSGSPEEQLNEFFQQYLNVFSMTFAYYCIASGVVLTGVGIFTYLSYHQDAHHRGRFTRYLSIIASILIGMGLMLLSTTVLTGTSEIIGDNAWSLPLLLFILLILLAINHVPDRSHGHHDQVSQLEK